VVNHTLSPTYPLGKSFRHPLDRRLGGPQSWSGCCGEQTPFLGRAAYSKVTTLNRLTPVTFLNSEIAYYFGMTELRINVALCTTFMVDGLVMWNDHVEKSKDKGITEYDSENVYICRFQYTLTLTP